MQLYSHPSLAADTKARVKHASAWLAANAARTTEERTYQLLGMFWAGADRSSLGRLAQELKATQQTDGGWNSRDGRASDAYSTGQVLVALHDAAGISPRDGVWQRGLQYLLSTQAADGSWHVETRLRPPAPVSPPYLETGYPYGHDQFISTMGASLAVMALARALGPARKAAPAFLTEAAPENVEPWAETVLFGSPADVRALLDKGFDPNSLTQGGGTTALMLAMPDLEKAKLLIERGANVNGRSKSKFSPLMVAANYPGSTATMRLLLDRGAQVLRPLREAGDDPNSKMNVIGMFPSTPLLGITTWGNAVLVRGLLDCGAAVDQADDDVITPLG